MSFVSDLFAPLRGWIVPVQSVNTAQVFPAQSPLETPSLSPAPSAPPARFTPLCHPLVEKVSKDVNIYFLENWKFEDEKARKRFVAANFSGVTCLYFPQALNDRVHFACRLLTILFLIDDVLEHMSFDEGSAYNEHLIPICRGVDKPDQSVPAEYILYDLWNNMRRHDKKMADEILEPVFEFMRAQTDKVRAKPMGLKEYFIYREKDVGRALLAALMRFSMALHLNSTELSTCRLLEQNCSKHLSVINDVFSYEKELKAAENLHNEGGVLCTSVKIMATEADVSIESSKRILMTMCREWEICHEKMVASMESETMRPSSAVMVYAKGLEYQMSGNELWSRTTKRYKVSEA